MTIITHLVAWATLQTHLSQNGCKMQANHQTCLAVQHDCTFKVYKKRINRQLDHRDLASYEETVATHLKQIRIFTLQVVTTDGATLLRHASWKNSQSNITQWWKPRSSTLWKTDRLVIESISSKKTNAHPEEYWSLLANEMYVFLRRLERIANDLWMFI